MSENLAPNPRIILSVPGNWQTHDELFSQVKALYPEVFIDENMLIDLTSGMAVHLRIEPQEDQLRRTFEVAGLDSFTESLLDQIEQHRYVVYLWSEGGDFSKAHHMLEAANMIFQAGGIAVKIDTSGKAFMPEQWEEIIQTPDHSRLFSAFVLMLNKDDFTYYSCGMHNLGLRDSIISYDDPDYTPQLLQVFLLYQILKKPNLNHMETFQINGEGQVYHIVEEPNVIFPLDHPFHNPYGMWRLSTFDPDL